MWKRKEKGLRISDSALLLVIFKQHHGNERVKCPGCHMIQLKPTGKSKGKVNVFNISTQKLPSLMNSGLTSFQSKRQALTGWRVCLSIWNIPCCIWNRLRPKHWAISTVWLCWHMICLRSGSDGPQANNWNSLCTRAFTELMFNNNKQEQKFNKSKVFVCVCVCMQHTEEDLSVLVPSLQTGKIHKELNNSLLTGWNSPRPKIQ